MYQIIGVRQGPSFGYDLPLNLKHESFYLLELIPESVAEFQRDGNCGTHDWGMDRWAKCDVDPNPTTLGYSLDPATKKLKTLTDGKNLFEKVTDSLPVPVPLPKELLKTE